MACTLGTDEISKLVCGVVQSFHDGDSPPVKVTAGKRYWNDLGDDKVTRRRYHKPIRDAMRAKGCDIPGLTPADLTTHVKVQDTVDAVVGACDCG